MKDVVIFHLAKYLSPEPSIQHYYRSETLYEQIKSGRKTSEWREATPYWFKRLLIKGAEPMASPYEIDYHRRFWKVHRALFVEGYPKANLPRLEAEITGVVYHPSRQLETKFTNVQEITEQILRRRQKLSVENEKVAKLLDSQRRRLAYCIYTFPLLRKAGASHFMDDYFIRRKQYVDEAIEKLKQKEP